MTVSLSKGFHGIAAFPHKLSSIVVTVGGLALFLVLGSLLISYPISSAITGYIYNANHSVNALTAIKEISQSSIRNSDNGNANVVDKDADDGSTSQSPRNFSNSETKDIVDQPETVTPLFSSTTQVDSSSKSGSPSGPDIVDPPKNSDRISTGLRNHSDDSSPKTSEEAKPTPSNEETNTNPVNLGALGPVEWQELSCVQAPALARPVAIQVQLASRPSRAACLPRTAATAEALVRAVQQRQQRLQGVLAHNLPRLPLPVRQQRQGSSPESLPHTSPQVMEIGVTLSPYGNAL